MTSPITTCRSCADPRLRSLLSLGSTPLANSLLPPERLGADEPRHPLDLVFCPGCALVQLRHTAPAEQLFRDYCYFSSWADTMVRHAGELAGRLVREAGLGPASLVVEAASNDGYLLRHYAEAGVPVLGIEPARNIAAVARRRGVETLDEFFTEDLARRLAGGGRRADLFHAHNVLAHVPDLNGFVRGIRAILRDDGLAVVEAPYVRCLIEQCEFDTIYHEHLCYFSLTAVEGCFRRAGLVVTDVELVPIHGGSLRVFARPAAAAPRPGPRVDELLQRERLDGLASGAFYADFAGRVRSSIERLREVLGGLKRRGHRLAAYGASAKGSTLLNCSGIGPETLDYVVDRSTAKQGLYTPGTHLKIYSPDKLLEDRPDYVLLLTWNLTEEVLEQQAAFRRQGGRFIIPVPHPRVA